MSLAGVEAKRFPQSALSKLEKEVSGWYTSVPVGRTRSSDVPGQETTDAPAQEERGNLTFLHLFVPFLVSNVLDDVHTHW